MFSRSFVSYAFLAGSLALAGCGGSAAYTPSPLSHSSVRAPLIAGSARHAWARGMIGLALPGGGCFRASYPATNWTRVACIKPPNIPFSNPHPRGNRPDYIGNGGDWTLASLPFPILGAIGSFPVVNKVKTAVTCNPKLVVKNNTCKRGSLGPDSYSLQLNSNNFWTAVCPGQCMGWEQFVYTNNPSGYKNGGGLLIIQDWYLATSKKAIKCQAGWLPSGGSCYRNADVSIYIPNIPASTLKQVSLAGSAASTGDSVFLANDTTGYVYGMKNAQDDRITELASHWTNAEFNVFGTGGGWRVLFNRGSDITVSIEAITGYNSPPKCIYGFATTGEENNMAFDPAPNNPKSTGYPSVLFRESNPRLSNSQYYATPPSCDVLPGLF